eukprot:TRINITY_DN113259_c0_g1_i1.p1 TRINITY_DN113259_c0_g1~~TRINITY_DN113259_c0_g1_i1.p1  ORF type:complete len:100 (+),score=53.87 TRINITY_DN113259_c0_g1_i1:21-320(+)
MPSTEEQHEHSRRRRQQRREQQQQQGRRNNRPVRVGRRAVDPLSTKAVMKRSIMRMVLIFALMFLYRMYLKYYAPSTEGKSGALSQEEFREINDKYFNN